MSMSADIKEFYDGFAAQQAVTGVNERHRMIHQLALTHGLADGRRVLEMGCGIGTLTSLIAKDLPHGSLLAVDLSPVSIERAKAALGHHRQLELRVADVVADPLPGPFDLIILPDILEHIPLELHPKLFQRLQKDLAPQGRILIHSPEPHYSDHIRATRPELMQVVDLALHVPTLVERAAAAGLILHHFQRHSIWTSEPDYMALVLVHKPNPGRYDPKPAPLRSLPGRMRSWLTRFGGR